MALKKPLDPLPPSVRTAHAAVRSLAAKGLIELVTGQGTVEVQPSSRFPLFRDHLRPAAKKG